MWLTHFKTMGVKTVKMAGEIGSAGQDAVGEDLLCVM